LDTLPPIISYSTLEIPISGQSGSKVTLARRDLYDVRYQLIAQEEGEENDVPSDEGANKDAELSFVDNPSDLAPGLYEGGLKTWECSLDLVDVLEGRIKFERGHGWVRGKRAIEIGCGTAVPSLYLLQQLLHEPSGQVESTIVLQDFNDLVIRLVTFPNAFLTWYTSSLADRFRTDQDQEEPSGGNSEDVTITITQDLKDAFIHSLKEQKISLRFLAGSWDAILDTKDLFESPFDVVLTSETIYRTESLPTLIELLRRACGEDDAGVSSEKGLEPGVKKLSLHSNTLCLVAAKILYFGVGGSIIDFQKYLQSRGATYDIVFNKALGVARQVLSLQWGAQ
ncbi:hypothetical protein SCHPADRAFT_851690, partial [Schizopora paradoxa]